MKFLVTTLILAGSALMVFNISGFMRFSKDMQEAEQWGDRKALLQVPIVLLVLFLIGYLAVGIFGHPDIVVAGILFGGSVFVLVMYWMLKGVSSEILEQEQEKAKLLAAEEGNRTKVEFLSSMSHEMRTPMNVILGLNRKALRSPSLSPELRELLEKTELSARHLLDLINNVLDVNRMEKGVETAGLQPFSLQDVLNQVDAIAATGAEEKSLTYSLNTEGDISGTYMGDAVMLKQLLLILLENAVKFTAAPGRIWLTVKKLPEEQGRYPVQFAVGDTGIGISEEFIPKVFEVFSKEDDSSTDAYGGSGLGLAVAKRICEAMGGTISVTSEKNRGSVFTAMIPLEAVQDAGSDVAEEESHLAGKRVLIVEDIAENAEIVADLLELEEVESEHAENGKIAVDLFVNHPAGYYDAILMDLRMPVMDGLEAASRIRASGKPDAKTVPIIALTANALEGDVQRSLEAGMNAHLAKPADSVLLYQELNRWMGPDKAERRGCHA